MSLAFTNVSSIFRSALLQRVPQLSPEPVNSFTITDQTLSVFYPDRLSSSRQRALSALDETEVIASEIGNILAAAVRSEKPSYEEHGYTSPEAYYLDHFFDYLIRLVDGKQSADITKNQMERVCPNSDFFQFLDRTLPEIAKVAESRNQNIAQLTKKFVSGFEEEVRTSLGDYALKELKRLNLLIVDDLKNIRKRCEGSDDYLDFNLAEYFPEFTKDSDTGYYDGLNIFISVGNHQGPKASFLLGQMALNISKAGFHVMPLVVEGEEDDPVYRIAIPLGEA
jgi:hypothetical protein